MITKEKAIKILEEIIDEGWLISDFDKCTAIDACEMAIEALEQGSILDKARAEITNLADSDAYGDYQQGFNFGLMRAAQIIDKYRTESEAQE